jgi:hypothetical protein
MDYKFNDITGFSYSGAIKPDCYENICAVFVGDTQLIESTLTSAKIFKDTYYKQDAKLVVNSTNESDSRKMRIVYYDMPELKKVESNVVTGGNVMVPVEFIPLVKAKLRAEMYKIANEDGLATKWMNDYNVLLETFKQWIISKKPKFGIE